MAEIVPFIGLRYNEQKIPNLGAVVTPPYDIIDEAAQTRYYAEHPANIIRLELGLTFLTDDEQKNRYSRAAEYLNRWIEEDILVYESQPALYLYQQEFKAHGTSLVRNGFICGLKVEDYSAGTVLPHEETLSKPKEDRLRLMRATRCNFSSIFGLYSDPSRTVDTALLKAVEDTPPEIEIYDEAGEIHRLWVITDEAVIRAVVEAMKDKQIFIADGHHRYETALEFAREMKAQGYQGYDYVMITLVNLYDQGLVILPTHRVVGNIPDFDLGALRVKLEQYFEVHVFGSVEKLPLFLKAMEEMGKTRQVFGMYGQNRILYMLTLKPEVDLSGILPEERSDAWRQLGVAVLDNLVLDHLLGIDAEKRKSQENLVYTKDASWAVERIEKGTHQVAFFLNPTRVTEVVDVAQARDKMPQKATYFYPKLLTGLVINPLERNAPAPPCD
ncbi:MAG: DUF1015 domain-containing protein [Syntrophomonadaceae bacterium]|jgi:uncharacterized protein (DUF1015 family)|nr:DUF1015 domain-containing protein [Syntrophomonadaceae bacterium]MDH7497147.1 DUF1015 domain-containing protein [Syntrophomonadaceae bacterium]